MRRGRPSRAERCVRTTAALTLSPRSLEFSSLLALPHAVQDVVPAPRATTLLETALAGRLFAVVERAPFGRAHQFLARLLSTLGSCYRSVPLCQQGRATKREADCWRARSAVEKVEPSWAVRRRSESVSVCSALAKRRKAAMRCTRRQRRARPRRARPPSPSSSSSSSFLLLRRIDKQAGPRERQRAEQS